jgi:hypothetical protein
LYCCKYKKYIEIEGPVESVEYHKGRLYNGVKKRVADNVFLNLVWSACEGNVD